MEFEENINAYDWAYLEETMFQMDMDTFCSKYPETHLLKFNRMSRKHMIDVMNEIKSQHCTIMGWLDQPELKHFSKDTSDLKLPSIRATCSY